jgi:hypothetical protein
MKPTMTHAETAAAAHVITIETRENSKGRTQHAAFCTCEAGPQRPWNLKREAADLAAQYHIEVWVPYCAKMAAQNA